MLTKGVFCTYMPVTVGLSGLRYIFDNLGLLVGVAPIDVFKQMVAPDTLR